MADEAWEIKYVAPLKGYMFYRDTTLKIEEGWEPFAVWGNGIIAVRRRAW